MMGFFLYICTEYCILKQFSGLYTALRSSAISSVSRCSSACEITHACLSCFADTKELSNTIITQSKLPSKSLAAGRCFVYDELGAKATSITTCSLQVNFSF